jgi:hypothetical protein
MAAPRTFSSKTTDVSMFILLTRSGKIEKFARPRTQELPVIIGRNFKETEISSPIAAFTLVQQRWCGKAMPLEHPARISSTLNVMTRSRSIEKVPPLPCGLVLSELLLLVLKTTH